MRREHAAGGALRRFAHHVNLRRRIDRTHAARAHRRPQVAHRLQTAALRYQPARIAIVLHGIVEILHAVVVRSRHARHDRTGEFRDQVKRGVVEARVRIGIRLVDQLDVGTEVLCAPEGVRQRDRQRSRLVLVEVVRAEDAHHRARLSGERAGDRLRGIAVDIHEARLAEADADGRIDGVDRLPDRRRKSGQRIARQLGELTAKVGVLRRRIAEHSRDLRRRVGLAGTLRIFGEMQRAEAPLHGVHPAVIGESIVILEEDHAWMGPARDDRDLRGEVLHKAAIQRTGRIRLVAVTVHQALERTVKSAADRRDDPPADLDIAIGKLPLRPRDGIAEALPVRIVRAAVVLLVPRPDQHKLAESIPVVHVAQFLNLRLRRFRGPIDGHEHVKRLTGESRRKQHRRRNNPKSFYRIVCHIQHPCLWHCVIGGLCDSDDLESPILQFSNHPITQSPNPPITQSSNPPIPQSSNHPKVRAPGTGG